MQVHELYDWYNDRCRSCIDRFYKFEYERKVIISHMSLICKISVQFIKNSQLNTTNSFDIYFMLINKKTTKWAHNFSSR